MPRIIINETDDEVVAAMEEMGGSFVKALAKAYRLADMNNKAILRRAFARYWAEYVGMAQRIADRNNIADEGATQGAHIEQGVRVEPGGAAPYVVARIDETDDIIRPPKPEGEQQ